MQWNIGYIEDNTIQLKQWRINLDIGGIVRIFTCKQVKAMQWMGGNSEIIMAMLEHSTTVGNYPAVMTCYLSISYYITLDTRDHKY